MTGKVAVIFPDSLGAVGTLFMRELLQTLPPT